MIRSWPKQTNPPAVARAYCARLETPTSPITSHGQCSNTSYVSSRLPAYECNRLFLIIVCPYSNLSSFTCNLAGFGRQSIVSPWQGRLPRLSTVLIEEHKTEHWMRCSKSLFALSTLSRSSINSFCPFKFNPIIMASRILSRVIRTSCSYNQSRTNFNGGPLNALRHQ